MKMQSDKENRMMLEMHEMMHSINVMPMPGDPDHHFAIMMKMHHKGAIHMAEVELLEGNNNDIKQMAELIIQKQQQEIAQLEGFLEYHLPGAPNEEFNMQMETCMDNMDNNANLQKINGNVDHDFAMLMTSHHQGAIDMANLVIHFGHNESIQRLAREIKEDQEGEIQEFQNWLVENPK